MNKKIFTILITALFFITLAGVSHSAPMFPDVPEKQWARDAVADLAGKGILEGYPDGTFKGDRATTRYEMAMMIQRLLAKMEQEHSQFATKADMEAIRAIAMECKEELDALGVRTTALESACTALDKRVTELERIRFYGYLQFRQVGMDLNGQLANVGTRTVPVVDWTNGRILQKGSGFTALGKLGTLIRLNQDSNFGIEVVGYNSTGDQVIDQYWGISAPYLSNPYTAKGTNAGGLQSLNNSPWTRVTLDRAWYRYEPTNMTFIAGSFNPEIVDGSVLLGQRNPNISAPYTLPFYGINVKGQMSRKSPLEYEALYSVLAQASRYQTSTIAGSMKYKFSKGRFKVNYMHANNSNYGDGVNLGPGGVVMPNYPTAPGNVPIYWRNRNGLTSNPNLGPQDMGIFGADLEFDINKNWLFYAKYATSSYDPDTTNRAFAGTATGNLFNAGIKAKYDKITGQLEYLSVDSTYDPFILQYPGPDQGIPVFLPYSTYYFNYYQLHDYNTYPSNRQGLRVSGQYNFSPKTSMYMGYGRLEQVKASTIDEFTKIGHIEPLFGYLQGGGSEKGYVQDFGAWLSHNFGKAYAKMGYGYYNQRRASNRLDDIDLVENLYYLNLAYNLSENVDLFGNFYNVDYKGHNGISNVGFNQQIPSIGGVYRFTKESELNLSYKYYNYHDTKINNADWNGGQFMMEYKMKF